MHVLNTLVNIFYTLDAFPNAFLSNTCWNVLLETVRFILTDCGPMVSHGDVV